MSIYVYKNNQPMGPFEESRILEWLASGQLSYEDLAIRHGATEWTKLRQMFPGGQMMPPQQPPAQQQNFYGNGVSPVGAVVGPMPKKGGNGLVVLILALVGMFLVAIIGTAAIFAFNRIQRKTEPVNISKSNTNSSSVPVANTNTQSFKALTDKSKELAKLKPPVKLNSKPILKEKVALVQQSDTSNEYAINMQGYYSSSDTVNELDLKNFGLTPERLAKTPEEIDTLIQTLCSKGRKIGTYSSKYGVIPAYSNVCKVSIIDYKESKVIAQKSFENRKLAETTTVYPTTTENVAIMPYEEVEKYISGLSKNK